MEIICINNTFSQEILEIYKEFNVTIPELNEIYSIRRIRNERGTIGFLLNELVNPDVPIISPISGNVTWIEPSWKHSRFTTLTGQKIEIEETNYEVV